MPNYRRSYIPGGTYFFTVKTERNAPLFQKAHNVQLLGKVFREMKQRWPLEINAVVVLPDHLHAIWTLPPGDANYPKRWAWLKREFTNLFLERGGNEQLNSESKQKNRRRGIWQRKYWEHAIRDEDDFDAHFDYVHWNPVKHGYVNSPNEWPYSSFHRWVKRGVYSQNWGDGKSAPDKVTKVLQAGE